MLLSNSGMSWDFHHRRTKFFMSRVWSLPKHFLSSVTFLGTKTPMLLAPFVACRPKTSAIFTAFLDRSKTYREFHFVGMNDTHNDLCHHCFSFDKPHLSYQKWLYILPSTFNTYWDELTAWVEGGLSYWQLDFAWGLSKVIQERSLMDGYKVIFESWEHWWGVSQLQQWWKRSLCVSFIPTEWDSRCFWSAQVSCQDGRCFWYRKGMGCHLWREPTTWRFWLQKK